MCLCGLLLSFAGSILLTRSHAITTVIRAPTVNELGDLNGQKLVNVTPGIALGRYVDQLVSKDLQTTVFEESRLLEELSENSTLTPSQIFSQVQKELSVNRVKHDYYELDKEEKTPFKEVSLTLVSSEHELAAEYIEALIKRAHEEAALKLTNDIRSVRVQRIKDTQDQLLTLTQAATATRSAEIKRLEEINREKLSALKLQIDLQVSKARKNRENQIVRLKEALDTAKVLNIVAPVTWEDLRTDRVASEINNEFGGADKSEPLYFQGTRILSAELKRLESRSDDRPFISGLTDLEKQILELENDPKIAALKARKDDSIYVGKYDELQRSLSELGEIPTQFDNMRLAYITQSPVISPGSTRSPKLVFLAGLIVTGFLALLITIIRISLRKQNSPVTA